MKVKDLIKYLETKDEEDIVGIFDLGQDTGDFIPLEIDFENNNDLTMLNNLIIYPFEKVIRYMKDQGQDNELEKLLDESKK